MWREVECPKAHSCAAVLLLCCCYSQDCSFLRGQTPCFPGASVRLRGASGRPRGFPRDLREVCNAPNDPETIAELPAKRPRRSRSASRRPQKKPGEPKGPPRNPRGFQEASQEGPEKPKSTISFKCLIVFGLRAFSAHRRPKTAQEAPQNAPGRPKRPPRGPQDSPKRRHSLHRKACTA